MRELWDRMASAAMIEAGKFLFQAQTNPTMQTDPKVIVRMLEALSKVNPLTGQAEEMISFSSHVPDEALRMLQTLRKEYLRKGGK
jgi:hypothetical protein